MKETQLLGSIRSRVQRYAKKQLLTAGYVILPDMPLRKGDRAWQDKPGEKGLAIIMSVVGYSRRYDGWEYELTDRDWKTILSLPWEEEIRKILQYMKFTGNKNLTLPELESETGVEMRKYWVHKINKEFLRNRLPYHFGFTHRKPSTKNGYPSMVRMFKRPVPIDGTGIVTEEEE